MDHLTDENGILINWIWSFRWLHPSEKVPHHQDQRLNVILPGNFLPLAKISRGKLIGEGIFDIVLRSNMKVSFFIAISLAVNQIIKIECGGFDSPSKLEWPWMHISMHKTLIVIIVKQFDYLYSQQASSLYWKLASTFCQFFWNSVTQMLYNHQDLRIIDPTPVHEGNANMPLHNLHEGCLIQNITGIYAFELCFGLDLSHTFLAIIDIF